MKTTAFFIIIMAACYCSCSKDATEILTIDPSLMELEKQVNETINSNISLAISNRTHQPACEAPLCEIFIPEYASQLQELANKYCLPAFDCVECCLNNWLVYATLNVQPDKFKCGNPFQKLMNAK